jgi:hypothetical protein
LAEFQEEIERASAHYTQAVQNEEAPTTIAQDVEELVALLEDSLTQTSTNATTEHSATTQEISTFDTINKMFDQATTTLDQEMKSYQEIYDSLAKKLDTHTSTLDYHPTQDTTKYVVPDPGAISSCSATCKGLQPTGKKSTKTFKVATGEQHPATDEMLLPIKLRDPARTVHVVPTMQHAPLLSVGKVADADYTTVIDKDTVTVYNTADVKCTVRATSVLRGTRDPSSTLW